MRMSTGRTVAVGLGLAVLGGLALVVTNREQPVRPAVNARAAATPTAVRGGASRSAPVAVREPLCRPIDLLVDRATEVSRRDVPAAAGEPWRRQRLVQTPDFKYQQLLVEETVKPSQDAQPEQVLERQAMVADQLMVRLRPGATEADLRRLNAEHGAQILRQMLAPGLFLVKLKRPSLDAVKNAVAAYTQAAATVSYAEPDYLVYALELPNDPSFDQLWGLHNTGQEGGTADADIDALEAWDIMHGSRDVKVGVIDTGVDYNHEDLAANIWTNPGEIAGNGLDDDGNGFVDDVHGWDFCNDDNDPMDDHYHGTHCSGTIGGVGHNGIGVAGVNWTISIVAIKFLSGGGSGSISDAVDATYYGTNVGCHLTSNSWGGGGFSQAMKDAIDDAGTHGILFVAAAGNESADNDASPHYPSSYDSANLIAVAATDRNDALASFSCYGLTSVDLSAPGVDVYSTKPGNTYGNLSGTSMATPHVAGVCALVKAMVPSWTAADIKARVLENTDPLPALAGKCVTGGRLNAFKAVLISQEPLLRFAQASASDAGGNADGILNPGEPVDLLVTLRNVGLDPAAGVTATVATADAYATVVDAAAAFGDMAGYGAAKQALDPFAITLSPTCPTPHELTLDLTITDAAARTWTDSFTVMIYTSSQISGTVTRVTGGTGIAGATVSYTGPMSGTATTGADGSYMFGGIDGTYSLVARAAGFLDSAPRAVTIPPATAGVDFALGMADIAVTPAALALTAAEGAADTTTLDIGNLGDVTLTWALPTSDYTVSDSDSPGGPAYAWTEIAGTGTEITGLGDDSNVGPFDLGFSFPFYGQNFTSFRVCSNGWLSFTSATTSYSNTQLPSSSAPENLVAFFWDDLYFGTGSTAWYQLVDASTLVVEFKDVTFYSDSSQKVTVEAILTADGGIVLQYQTIQLATSCTVGVQNADRTRGSQAVYNAAYLHDALAVAIRQGYGAPWLAASPTSGAVAPAASQTLAVTASAATLDAGTHQATLAIASNDTDEPVVTIPVTFTVTGAPRLAYATQTVNDDATAPSSGDGDGVAEPGETVELGVTIVNTGHAPATGLTGVLSTADPEVTLLTTSSGFPDAAGGAEVAAALPYVVRIAPTCPAVHQVPLTLTVTDNAGHQWPLAISLSVTAHAQLTVSPPSLTQTVTVGQTANQPLTIGNTGTLALDWTAATGLGGFTVTNSDQAGGPAYAWTDIAGTGTEITGLGDDTNVGPFNLGFSFPFYNASFTSFRVCSNGWLSFTSTGTSYSNTALPSASAPENLVACCWADLNFVTGSTAWYRLVDAGTLVVEFKDVAFYSDRTKKVTCQAILKADGTILLQYQTVDRADACTVGVQNAERTKGVTVVHNAALLHAGLAVQLTPTVAWLALNPAAGTAAPGGSSTVTATFNAAGLDAGTYTTTVQVTSNDWRTPVVNVPVTLTVSAVGNPPVIVSPAWADPNPVTLPAGTTVHVVASDPDGDPLTYAWSQVSGAGTATFAAPDAADSGVTFSGVGIYGLRVTVTDSHGASVISDVSVVAIGDVDPRADVNHDGVVNALDLQIVIANFGQTVRRPSSDPRADANGDGVVNALDLQIIIANFGKTVP